MARADVEASFWPAKVVEGLVGHANDAIGYVLRAFRGCILRMFEAVLPLVYRPAIEVVAR